MDSLGDRPADEVTTRDINTLLAAVSVTGVSARTVKRSRQFICAIYNFASREATFGLPHNPATAADRRPEPERARLDFYSPEEVEALARAVAAGLHRDPRAPAVSEEEAAARAAEDSQDAELRRANRWPVGMRPCCCSRRCPS
jgi:integrase